MENIEKTILQNIYSKQLSDLLRPIFDKKKQITMNVLGDKLPNILQQIRLKRKGN